MRNSLSMDFYRLLKTKATYIIYLCYVGFMTLMIYSMHIMKNNNQLELDGTVNELVNQFLPGNTIIFFVVIFVAIFINAEFNSGYIKNIMGDLSKKSNYVFSKIIIFAGYVAVYVLSTLIAALIASKLLNGKLDFTGFDKALICTGVIYLLNLSFACIMTLITILFRSTAASTSIGIIYTTTVASLLYMLINYGVKRLFGVDDFLIQKYLVEGNLLLVNCASKSTEILRGLIVGLIFAGVTIFASIQIVRKRDV